MTQKPGRQHRYAKRNPELHYARMAVYKATEDGRKPKARTLLCTDCGLPAREYDHYLGYEREHWLDVQPVCRRCHLDREMARRTHCKRGHEYTEESWKVVEGFKRRKCWICTRMGAHKRLPPVYDQTLNTRRVRKTTEDDVRGIRAATGTEREIARLFGVAASSVHNIRARKSWKHVA